MTVERKLYDFKETLKDLILDAGLSLRQLAKESGVSAMQYSRYLRGYIPTIEVTLKIAKYFDCTIDYLFALTSQKNSRTYKTYDCKLSVFIERYQKLLKQNITTHFKFSQNNIFDESIIRHWQKGVTPRLDVVYIIAKNLGGSMDDLIGKY